MAKAKSKKITLEEALVPVEEQLYEVPENWCWTRLAIVASIYNGDRGKNYPSKRDYVKEGIPFINAGTICENKVNLELANYITEDKFNALSAGKIKKNDILYCLRGSLGKCAIITEEYKGAISSSLCIMRSENKAIDVKYLLHLLNSDVILKQQNEVDNGSAQPNLSAANVAKYQVPLPPLAEQQRIVEQIEGLFAKLDEAKEKAQEAVDLFENVQRAILYDAFRGRLTASWRQKKNIDIWKEYTIQHVCSMKITDGTHKTPTYCEKEEGGYPFISSKDVTSKRICWDNIKYIVPELHDELYARLAPQKDDVLLAKNGTTGVAAIVEDDRVFDIYVTLAVLRPNKDIINPRYLLNIVNSPVCKKQFDEHLTGIGVPNLHLRNIKEVKINVPSLEEQEEVVRLVDTIIEKEQKAAETAEKTVEMIGLIKKSILAKAFRGELGTNIETEESAIELLKSIL